MAASIARWNRILERLERTGYRDIRHYVAMAMYCVRENSWILSAERPDGGRGEILRISMDRSRDPKGRDGVGIGILYNCDALVHGDEKHRCLHIYLEYIDVPPPANVVGASPVFVIPIHIFDGILIGMDRRRHVQLQPPFPEGSGIWVVFPYSRLRISIRRLRMPAYDGGRDTYLLEIENEEGR